MKKITFLGVLLLFCSMVVNAQTELSDVEREQLKAANLNIQRTTVDINAVLQRAESTTSLTGYDETGLSSAEKLALRNYLNETNPQPDGPGCPITSDCNLNDSTPDDATSPFIWDRPFAGGTCCSGLGPVSYDVYGPFSVDTNGAYDVLSVQAGWDGYLFVYENCFDPLDQLNGFVAGDDDGAGGIGTSDIIGVMLSTGVDYYIVTTGFAAGDFGPYTTTITGPGSFTCPSGGGGGAPCDQMTVTPGGGVENGRGCSANQNWTVANDFIVPTGENAEVTQIVARILVNTGATITQADIGLWDDAGVPNMNLGTQAAVVPTSQPVVGTAFGRDVLEVTFDPTPIVMAGNPGTDVTYWISLQVTTSDGGDAFWEDQSPDVIGEFLAFENNGAGWAIPATRDGVYTFVADCTPIGITNDTCANATTINCGQTLSGDTGDDIDTNGDGSPDEWFAVTSSVAGELITVSTCDQAAYDTILTVYDSCGGAVVATNDDGPGCTGFTSELSFVADGSSTYYIAVDGFGGASGTFDLTVTCGPINDDPCGALAIECGVPVFGNTDTANDDTAAAPDCDTPTSASGIWYIYEDTTGLVTDILLSTCSANTDYDTKISVYTGDCTSLPLTCVAGNDDSPNCTNFQSEVEFQSDGNTTFYILVHGFGGATGNFELNMTCTPVPPPNDMIQNSIDVDEIGVPYTDPAVAMPAATLEAGSPTGCDISGGLGVWYNFTSAGNGTATAEIVSPAGNSFVVFFTAPNEMAIETDLEYFFQIGNQCAPGTVANINTAAGQVYYVYVVNDGGITDITIDGTLLSTSDNVIEGFSFYPNPTNGTLNLDSVESIEDVAIYNLLG